MRVWAIAVLLVAAVLAEKALARPEGAADDKEKDYQDDTGADEAEEAAGSAGPANPPKLLSAPVTLTPKPGDTVLLPCQVVNPPQSLIWLNNTQSAQGATLFLGQRRLTFKDDPRLILHANNSLEIQNVQPSDAGDYTCKISTSVQVVHHLNLFVPPHMVSTQPSERNIILQKGEHITMRCNVTGNPEPKITWTRKERNLPSSHHGHHEHHGDNLHFSHVSTKHMGTYVCSATNELGTAEHSFSIAVSDVPEIEVEKEMVNTDIGQSPEIACIVHAFPPAKVSWFFNNEEHLLVPSPHLEIYIDKEYSVRGLGQRHVVRVDKVTEKDFGNYNCVAENEKGSARRRVTRLSGAPTTAKLEEVTYEKGKPVLLWTVESQAPINKYEMMYRRKDSTTDNSVQFKEADWTTVELPASQDEGSVYKVKYELKDTEGAEYEAQLKSHNSFGWSELSPKFPFTAESSRRAAPSRVGDAGNGAPVSRLSSALLLGAIAVLFTRS